MRVQRLYPTVANGEARVVDYWIFFSEVSKIWDLWNEYGR